MNSASVEFTWDELWLLQSVIRHEMQGQEMWKFPPASLDLNDQVARALIFCDESAVTSAFLELTRGDTLAIDYFVPNTAKDANGKLIGKTVLLKSFQARAKLADWFAAEAEEPSAHLIQEKLAEWQQSDQKIHTKYRNRRRKEDA